MEHRKSPSDERTWTGLNDGKHVAQQPDSAGKTPPPAGGATGAAPTPFHDEERAQEAQIIERCRRGDTKAFRILVERYERRVFSLALGLLKDPDEARDIAQEVFLKAHRHLGTFLGNSSFYTWLYRITVNLCIDRKRRVGRGSEVELDERLPHHAVGSPADVLSAQRPSFNPQRVAESSELRGRILAALGQLSEAHRAVLVLREVEGLSYKEIADSMDCPEGTVMSRLFHARRQMQQLLADFADDAEPEEA